MPSSSKLDTITSAFSNLRFEATDQFRWSPENHMVDYDLEDPHCLERLLHEVSHADLGHEAYHRDVELIEMERDAWEHARRVLAPRFDIAIESSVIEDDLDTYRDWLHARSTCPSCGGNGLQRADLAYECPSCRTSWTANPAKLCALRRYKKTRP